MAFNKTTAAAAAASSNDSWKADAFLNMYIDRPDGSSLKVGAVTFKTSKKTDAAMIQRLQEEGGIDAFKKAVRFDFRLVTDEPISDIGF